MLTAHFYRAGLLLALFCLNSATFADTAIEGIEFYHHDWQLTCDNTRTCRAAGYQADESQHQPVSVLLTRKAGANQAITAELMLGHFDDLPVMHNHAIKLSMQINDQALGHVEISAETFAGKLTDRQTSKLLAAITRDSLIQWTLTETASDKLANQHLWQLSTTGANAVLLKMDEFQGRLGTTGALVRRGNQHEDNVLTAIPMPVVQHVKPDTLSSVLEITLTPALYDELIRTADDQEDCFDLKENKAEAMQTNQQNIAIAEPLTNDQYLLSLPCWMAAYNAGSGIWVINAVPPYQPRFVTGSASNYYNGEIDASHKGRGIGDCWSTDRWIWNGDRFVHTTSFHTGLCRLIAPGGAWMMPTLVSDVQ